MAAVLRLTLTVVPRGDERRAIEIGTVEIENDQTGTEHLGNYKVRMRGTLNRGARKKWARDESCGKCAEERA